MLGALLEPMITEQQYQRFMKERTKGLRFSGVMFPHGIILTLKRMPGSTLFPAQSRNAGMILFQPKQNRRRKVLASPMHSKNRTY